MQSWTHSKHVIALHVLGVHVVALVVKPPEEVEGQDSVEIDHDGQQANSQDQLSHTHTHKYRTDGSKYAFSIKEKHWTEHNRAEANITRQNKTHKHTPVSHCAWLRTRWCEVFWRPLRCPIDGWQRRSCYSGPIQTWPCTRPSTRRTVMTHKKNTHIQKWEKKGKIAHNGRSRGKCVF